MIETRKASFCQMTDACVICPIVSCIIIFLLSLSSSKFGRFILVSIFHPLLPMRLLSGVSYSYGGWWLRDCSRWTCIGRRYVLDVGWDNLDEWHITQLKFNNVLSVLMGSNILPYFILEVILYILQIVDPKYEVTHLYLYNQSKLIKLSR